MARRWPKGRLNAEDDGELALRIAADKEKKVVIVDFGKEVVWIGMPPDDAIQFAQLILKHAWDIKGAVVEQSKG